MSIILIKRILRVLLAVVLAAAVLLVLLWVFFPSACVVFWQRTGMLKGKANTFASEQAQDPVPVQLSQKVELIQDICYGTTYPNSTLDIYRQSRAQQPAPVFLYLHGGGYAWGDKAEGDPTAQTSVPGAATLYLQKISAAGYTVVSLNYALSPEYTYPTPLLQIDEAIRFLQENAGRYGLDLSFVVISGGSAGGQLAGQYANLVSNPDYAADMGISPALAAKSLRGVVFSCALLEPAQFDHTGNLGTNLMFSALKRTYFGRSEAVLAEADVTGNLCEDFPPAYITDGNSGTFDAQAARLDETMTAMGIAHEYNYYPRTQAVLGHGYDSYLDDPYAQDNLDKVLAFLKFIAANSQ